METEKILNGFYQEEKPLKPRASQEACRWRHCLVMLASLYIQCMAMGTSVALSVLYTELITVFHAPMSKIVLHQSLFAGLLSGGGVFILPFVKRYGPGPSIIAGSVVAALGFIAASLVKNLAFITFTVGIMAGIGLSVTYLASTISVSWIFHNDPGTALAFLPIGTGLGRMLMPFITEVFVDLYRWDGAFLLLGCMSFQCVSCGCYIYTCKNFYKTGVDEKDISYKESIRKSFDRSLLTDAVVVLFVISCFFTTMIVSMPGFFVDILSSRGLPRSKGSELLSVFGLATMGGRIIGFLVKLKIRVLTVYHWVYVWPLVALCLVLSITARAYGWLITAIAFCGVLWGTATAMRYTITLDVCGLARYPQGVALTNSFAGLGRFFGYTLGGVSKDVTGCYDPAFYLSAAAGLYISLTSVIMALILRKRDDVKHAEDSIELSGQYTRLT